MVKIVPVITRSQIVVRAVRLRCPNCGEPLIFERRLQLRERCPHCAMAWRREGSDAFYLGAMVWNYTVALLVLLVVVVVPAAFRWLPWGVALALALVIAGVFPWVFYKRSWGLWLATYYGVLPHEVPGYSGADANDSEPP